jgi:HEAT repeat protein
MRRVYAAHGLAKLGDSSALPALLRVLGDDENDVRRAAALAIGELAPMADPESVRALVKLMDKDRDRGTRAMAAVALGLLGGDVAIARLRKSYSRDDATIRPFAAVALGVIARRDGKPALVQPLLRDLKRGTRHELLGATCVAVGLAGLEDAKPLLREIVVEGGDPQLVAQAAVSIGLIGDTGEGLDLLRGLLADAHDPMLRGEVALALGLLGDVSTLAVLEDMVKTGRTEHERISGCIGLGRIGGAESAAVLVGVLADEKRSRLERHMAGNALGMLLDTSEGKRVGRVPAGLNWYALTPTVIDILQEM